MFRGFLHATCCQLLANTLHQPTYRFCQSTRYHQTSGSGCNPLHPLHRSACTAPSPFTASTTQPIPSPNSTHHPALASTPSLSTCIFLTTLPLPQQDIIILQNKIDLVNENAAIQQHESIQRFIEGTIADGAPIVPISAQLMYNVDVVCEYIVKKIPVPVR